MHKEIEKIRAECARETAQLKHGYEKAIDEYKEFQLQKAEFAQKGRLKKADTETDFKEEASQMKTISNNEPNRSVQPPSSGRPQLSRNEDSDSLGDSDFERAEESADILNNHINPVDREKIQELLHKVNEFNTEESKKRTNEVDAESDFERDSVVESDEEYGYPKVKPVDKRDILPQAQKILQY